jgi:hypothetical protein
MPSSCAPAATPKIAAHRPAIRRAALMPAPPRGCRSPRRSP